MKIFHEIKNSVTVINSYLQLVEKKHPEISDFEYWDIAQSEISRLKTIVTELSQIRLGDDLHLEHRDLKNFLADCCKSFHGFDGKEDISCVLSTPESPCLVSMDARLLHHAILNLLKNSSEAMNQVGTIQIRLTQDETFAFIRITDSGCGIAPDIIEHIFEPFHTTKENGSGLGLSITEQLVTAHHGTISVASQAGKGCTFTIRLPLVSP